MRRFWGPRCSSFLRSDAARTTCGFKRRRRGSARPRFSKTGKPPGCPWKAPSHVGRSVRTRCFTKAWRTESPQRGSPSRSIRISSKRDVSTSISTACPVTAS
ncbi:MAG: hypothetical protein DCC46_09925 [Armatimonadetes bacterium]|nr:MAG: hypothetical protein DCC46_09925 [Armatimonadota bacterium]